jgi:hypothetical protein
VENQQIPMGDLNQESPSELKKSASSSDKKEKKKSKK